MSKIKTILSIIFIFTIWGCVSSAYPILWWSRECVLYLIIIKPEVWIINHCLGLGRETMVCTVCLTMFLRNLMPLFIKSISLYNSINFVAILYPTSILNLVNEVATRHSHQFLLLMHALTLTGKTKPAVEVKHGCIATSQRASLVWLYIQIMDHGGPPYILVLISLIWRAQISF